MPYDPEPFVVGQGPYPRPDEFTAPPMVREEADDEPREDEVMAASPPEHTWLGKGFIWTLYGAAAWGLVGSFFMLLSDDPLMIGQDSTIAQRLGMMLPIILFTIGLQLWTAKAIREFRLTGMGPAMLLLATMIFSLGWTLLHTDSLFYGGVSVVLLAFCVAWVLYLLARFRDFS